MRALLNVKNYEMFVDIIIHLFGRCCHHLCAIDGRNIVVALVILQLNMRSTLSVCKLCTCAFVWHKVSAFECGKLYVMCL